VAPQRENLLEVAMHPANVDIGDFDLLQLNLLSGMAIESAGKPKNISRATTMCACKTLHNRRMTIRRGIIYG
jgi:hypothetical protein